MCSRSAVAWTATPRYSSLRRSLHHRHREQRRSESSETEGAPQEVELVQQEVLGDDLLRRHVRDADQREHLVGPSGGEQRRRQLQRVGSEDVVVGEAVDQQQWRTARPASGSSDDPS